jgi:ABC-type nitrate/sulfonate/bicarbonate transport system substrate-binding protein
MQNNVLPSHIMKTKNEVLTEEQLAKRRDIFKKWYEANREKVAARRKAKREANPEKFRASTKAWREANPEKAKAYCKAWREANPENSRASTKAWKKANPEKVKAYSKAWKKANPEKVKAYCKAWREANPEKAKANEKAWREANRQKVAVKNKVKIESLTDGYIANVLGMPIAQIPPELIKAKRKQLLLLRKSIKEFKSALKEVTETETQAAQLTK